MRKLSYFAVYEPSNDGGFGVYFPDLPGCVSYGKNYGEASDMASEALGLHIYAMEKDGDDIPSPSSPEQLDIDADTANGFIVSPVTVYPDIIRNGIESRAVRTNVTIPAWLKDIAEERHVNYSQIMQTALREYLQV